MQTKFKRGHRVRILRAPDKEYVEYHTEESNHENSPIKEGMSGKINILLPNGKYHVEVLDENGEILAYAPFEEEDLEAVE